MVRDKITNRLLTSFYVIYSRNNLISRTSLISKKLIRKQHLHHHHHLINHFIIYVLMHVFICRYFSQKTFVKINLQRTKEEWRSNNCKTMALLDSGVLGRETSLAYSNGNVSHSFESNRTWEKSRENQIAKPNHLSSSPHDTSTHTVHCTQISFILFTQKKSIVHLSSSQSLQNFRTCLVKENFICHIKFCFTYIKH